METPIGPESSPSAGPGGEAWRRALDDLELALREAGRAVVALRRGIDGPASEGHLAVVRTETPDGQAGPFEAVPEVSQRSTFEGLWDRVVRTETPDGQAGPVEAVPEVSQRSTFERLWDRIEHEKLEKQHETPPEPGTERRGLDLLPHQYLMTVEDRETKVDLIPLHRALLGLLPAENIALVSFANGVPVISLRSDGELDLDRLGQGVAAAMDRQCEVISQDTGRLYLRLRSWQDQGE